MNFASVLVAAYAIGVIVLCGLIVLRWLPEPAWASGWPARIALAHLTGCGMMAWITTASALVFGRLSVLPFYILISAAALVTWIRRSALPGRKKLPKVQSTARSSLWQRLAIATLVLGVAATTWGLLSDRTMTMDAHWNWALKAKALFLAGSLNTIADGCCTHPNYPVLFPLQSWWVYEHLHSVADWLPQAIGYIFYLDLLALTFAACRASIEPVWAWIATAIVANDAIEIFNAPRGQADSAISAFFLASSIFLAGYFARRDQGSRTMILLLLLGAVQTKNEGLAWAAFAIALLVAFELRSRMYRNAIIFAGGFLFAIGPWMIFKHLHGIANGPEEQMATLSMLSAQRIVRIKTILIAHVANFGPYSFPFWMLLCLPLMWMGWKRISKPVLALLLIQFVAYLVIYFVVADQIHQLSFMLRAISQISPALLCLCMIAYRTRNEPAPADARLQLTFESRFPPVSASSRHQPE